MLVTKRPKIANRVHEYSVEKTSRKITKMLALGLLHYYIITHYVQAFGHTLFRSCKLIKSI